MKKAKKVISLLLAVIMLFGVTTSAFAEEKTLKEKINDFITAYIKGYEVYYNDLRKNIPDFDIENWLSIFEVAKLSGVKSDVFTAEELERKVVDNLKNDEDSVLLTSSLKYTISVLELYGIDSSNVGGKYNLLELFENVGSYLVEPEENLKSTLSAPSVQLGCATENLGVFSYLRNADKDTVNMIIDAILSCQAEDGHFDYYSQEDLKNNSNLSDFYFELYTDEFLDFTLDAIYALSRYALTSAKVQDAVDKAVKYVEQFINPKTGLFYYEDKGEKIDSIYYTASFNAALFMQNIDKTDFIEKMFESNFDEERNVFEEECYENVYNDEQEVIDKKLVKNDITFIVAYCLAYYLNADLTSKEVVATNEDTTVTVTANGFKSGTKVTVTNVENTAVSYKTLIKVAGVDEDNVIACVDITPNMLPDGTVELSFKVGTDYAGQKVTVYHLKDDGTTENLGTFEVVADGTVSGVKVDSFSPFMITLEEPEASTETTCKAVETAKTGDASIAVFGILAVVSLGAIVLTAKKKED
ncbi:MAG: hypothetical protein K5917_02535 [Clostridiales bacterium]|nr:hypothetical protein [Clostridiales bacterium]